VTGEINRETNSGEFIYQTSATQNWWRHCTQVLGLYVIRTHNIRRYIKLRSQGEPIAAHCVLYGVLLRSIRGLRPLMSQYDTTHEDNVYRTQIAAAKTRKLWM